VNFATKTQIALEQLETLLAQGAPKYCVLADAAYGVDQAFRRQLADLGLPYVVGITSAVVVWPPGVEPLAPKRYSGKGRPPSMPRRNRSRQPLSVKDLAQGLAPSAFHTISWREGTNQTLSGRFAAVRVRHAGGNIGKARLHPEQWLLIEWPAGDAEPLKYYLSNLPQDIALNDLVSQAHMRWRIERDYQDLKQELGFGHYEGRGWRGFHHHASLSIAAYGFLVAERLAADKPGGAKKNFAIRQMPALPADYIPRGSPARAAPRGRLDRHHTLRTELSTDSPTQSTSTPRSRIRKKTFLTQ
jgi:SRSO17 transposase